MSGKFKVGDRVICIDAEYKEFITNGETYTVGGLENVMGEPCVTLKEVDTHTRYFEKRFKLANSQIIRERLGIK